MKLIQVVILFSVLMMALSGCGHQESSVEPGTTLSCRQDFPIYTGDTVAVNYTFTSTFDSKGNATLNCTLNVEGIDPNYPGQVQSCNPTSPMTGYLKEYDENKGSTLNTFNFDEKNCTSQTN